MNKRRRFKAKQRRMIQRMLTEVDQVLCQGLRSAITYLETIVGPIPK